MSATVKLTPTARVVLGMLKLGAQTGYDIKRIVEVSTRFFWGASYGQIYPELRRLAADGLVEAEAAPRGGIARNVYRLTPKGERALRRWLTSDEALIFEYRDEALLKLFFADVLGPDELLAHVRQARAEFADVVLRFREIGADAEEDIEQGRALPYVALRYGIELMEWAAEWYADLERRLERGHALVEPKDLQSS
jgi:PadR family transcriptional regulator, regulatory protein AphA